MNYLKVYCNLIRKAEQRGYTKKNTKGQYVEGHHTFPVSIFGKNKRIVYLAAREHYIAHALLRNIYIKRYGISDDRTKKMIYAFWCMNNQKSKNTYINSYFYEKAKLDFTVLHSELMSDKTMLEETKLKISIANKGKVRTEEQRKRLSVAKTGLKSSAESIEKTRQKNIGKKRTEEQKARMSEAQKGLKKGLLKVEELEFKNKFIDAVKTSKTKKEIIVKLEMNSNNGSSFGSIDKWCNFLNLDTTHLIGASINKDRKHTEDAKEKMGISRRGKLKSEDHKRNIKLSNCKYVYTFTSPQGIITETVLYTDFCEENDLNKCKIREVARGVRTHHKGWVVTRRIRTKDDK